MKFFRLLIIFVTSLFVFTSAGCNHLSPRPEVAIVAPPVTQALANSPDARLPTDSVAMSPASGSIFNASPYRGMFEDRRARHPGDILTIQIQERTSARQKADSSLEREGKLEANVGMLPLLSPKALARVGAKGGSSNSMDAKGETGTDNTFTGSITVTVVRTLPNGNLLVSGDKQVGINQNVDVMGFSGVINPMSIKPGNVVVSTEVAEARLTYRGKGDIDRAQTTGFLSRFFLSWAPI
jgi:flagellar L-ring protein FlgH